MGSLSQNYVSRLSKHNTRKTNQTLEKKKQKQILLHSLFLRYLGLPNDRFMTVNELWFHYQKGVNLFLHNPFPMFIKTSFTDHSASLAAMQVCFGFSASSVPQMRHLSCSQVLWALEDAEAENLTSQCLYLSTYSPHRFISPTGA